MYNNAQTNRAVKHIKTEYNTNPALDFAESNNHIFPAYHTNKQNWITIILNDSLDDNAVFGSELNYY